MYMMANDVTLIWVYSVFVLFLSNDATKLRPTFQELAEKLRDLQSKYTIQLQATLAALLDNSLLKG